MNRSLTSLGAASAGIILSLSLLSSCENKEAGQQAAALPVVEVEVTKLVHKDVNITQEWIASLRGTEDADIRAQVSGYLISKNYKDGSYVKKGDVLFQIDKRPFEAALQQAEGALAQAKASYEKNKLDVERYTPLAAKESIGAKQLDDAKQSLLESQATMVSAQAAVDQARINLQFTTITAPISGLTGLAMPSIGNLLSPSTPEPLTTISAIDPIRVDYAITEKDLLDSYGYMEGEKKKPVQFDVLLANGDQYPYKGTPISLDRNVNTGTGRISIVGHIPNPDHLLRPGMFVRVKAVTKTIKNAALVPPRAIMTMQSSNFLVMVEPAENNTYNTRIIPVIPGPWDESSGNRLRIVEGAAGELPQEMTLVVEGLTQAIMRAGGKGQVRTRPYVDKLSQPVIQNRENKAADEQEQQVDGELPAGQTQMQQ